VFWTNVSVAQDADLDCDNAMTQRDMNTCAYQDYLAADLALNEVYAWAMSRAKTYENGADLALRDAQRAWIPYRDAACAAEGLLYEGGSIRPLIEYVCMATLTERRAQDMRLAYEDY
jgi:uncharacterized protein YecT (DUF1311 family)